MKFKAPPGVTALSSAGEEIIPDAQGLFEANEIFASDLLAHGCIPAPQETDRPRKKVEGKNYRKAD